MFEIAKVADQVYAAVAAPAYKVNSNAAIIETEDGVIVVDTHSKPPAARVVVEKIRELTAKPVRYVINTHFHCTSPERKAALQFDLRQAVS